MARGNAAAARTSEPVLSLREEQKRLTRSKLVEAARVVFHDKGYTNTTIDDIVERAGASRGTYYLYYKNKTEILEELLEEFNSAATDLAARLAELPHTRGKIPIADLEGWISDFVDLYRHHRLDIRAWIQAESADPALHVATDRNMNGFVDVLAERIAEFRGNTSRRTSAEDRVRALLMLVQLERFCYFWLIRGWKIDRKLAISTIARLWYDAIYSAG